MRAVLALALAIVSGAPVLEAEAPGLVRALLGRDAWREALRVAFAHGGPSPAPELRAARAEALYRAGRLEEAEAVLAPLASDPEAPARASMTLGLLRVAQGRAEEGARALDAALARAPDDPDVVFAAAEAALTRARSAELLARFLAFERTGDAERREAAEGALRLARALGERPTWVPVARPERVEIPLRALPDGAGGTRGYVVEADLGGKRPVPLLLDTGSGGLFLVARAVRKQAVPLSEDTVFAGGGEGRQATRRALLPKAALGTLAWKDALVTLAERELEPRGRFLGVIGLSVFDGYRVTLDLAAPRIVLEAGASLPEGEPYWTVQGQWLVQAHASGSPGLYLLDTGAGASTVSFEVAGTGKSAGPAARHEGYSGQLASRWAPGIEVSWGGRSTGSRTLAALDLAQRSRLGGVEIAGHLGLDLLAGRTVILDTVGHRVRVR